MVGSDAPGIGADYLKAALQALESDDVVLGPAHDGGYVLIGLRAFHKELFRDIQWGTERVLEQQLQRVREIGWSCALLETETDIDRPEDLRCLPPALQIEL